MSKGIISATVRARPLRRTDVDPALLLMGAGDIYIHDMTPELARQWIDTLTTIAEGEIK